MPRISSNKPSDTPTGGESIKKTPSPKEANVEKASYALKNVAGELSRTSAELKEKGLKALSPKTVEESKSDSGHSTPIEEAEQFDFEATILESDRKSLDKELKQAMSKIRDYIRDDPSEGAAKIRDVLKGSHGRDWLIYAPIQGMQNDLHDLLMHWDDSWSIEDTSALLMDIAIAAKDIPEEPMSGELSESLWQARGEKHSIKLESEWVQELEEFNINSKTGLQAGPSLSTAHVLRFLRLIKKTNPEEREAIVNGLIQYWKRATIKRLLGQYHTPTEVWAAYTHHLEREYAKMLIRKYAEE